MKMRVWDRVVMPEWLKLVLVGALFATLSSLVIVFARARLTGFEALACGIVLSLGVGGIVVGLLRMRPAEVESRSMPMHACSRCGYDLRSAPSAPCPECGADQPSTEDDDDW